MKLTYHIDLEPDTSSGYTATIREFPGCISEGESLQEATARILSVAEEWLEIATQNGWKLPAPEVTA